MLEWWESSQKVKRYINFSEIYLFKSSSDLEYEVKVTKI